MSGGVSINVKIDDRQVRELLARIQARAGDMRLAMKIIGQIVGRPDKWQCGTPEAIAVRTQ